MFNSDNHYLSIIEEKYYIINSLERDVEDAKERLEIVTDMLQQKTEECENLDKYISEMNGVKIPSLVAEIAKLSSQLEESAKIIKDYETLISSLNSVIRSLNGEIAMLKESNDSISWDNHRRQFRQEIN